MRTSNERGRIADTYESLQGLELLNAARDAYALPKATAASTLRTVFQAAEIALLNLTDLLARADADVRCRMIGRAMVKISWALGFHRVLARLGMVPHQLGHVYDAAVPTDVLRISDSPAFGEYAQVLRRFDQSVLQSIESGNLKIEPVLANGSLDSVKFRLLHLTRICNHETAIWEHDLAEVQVPAQVPSYEQFIGAKLIRDAVFHTELSGDTFLTQFVALHQIPETLGEEVNDHIEAAIRDIRSKRLQQSVEHLDYVNVLVEGILAAVPPMVDNLATSDFYRFRENLGQTSGSHSVVLRYHLFKDLYEQLWEELIRHVAGRPAKDCSVDALKEAVRRVDGTRNEDPDAWMVYLLFNHCLRLRAFIAQWRQVHLHLPRNDLGAQSTSLAGSSDAVTTVKEMRNAARAKDPMLPLAQARGLSPRLVDEGLAPLTRYLESESSLDTRVSTITGANTQRRFREVEERSGGFAERCPFSPPPRRKA